jgi:hypothetical protein
VPHALHRDRTRGDGVQPVRLQRVNIEVSNEEGPLVLDLHFSRVDGRREHTCAERLIGWLTVELTREMRRYQQHARLEGWRKMSDRNAVVVDD